MSSSAHVAATQHVRRPQAQFDIDGDNLDHFGRAADGIGIDLAQGSTADDALVHKEAATHGKCRQEGDESNMTGNFQSLLRRTARHGVETSQAASEREADFWQGVRIHFVVEIQQRRYIDGV